MFSVNLPEKKLTEVNGPSMILYRKVMSVTVVVKMETPKAYLMSVKIADIPLFWQYDITI